MTLTMVRRFRVEGMESGDEGPWFDPAALPPDTGAQLTLVAQTSTTKVEPSEAAARFAAGGYQEHVKHFMETGIVPLEIWDVLEGSEVAYTLWLYGVDCGALFTGRTADRIGEMCQGYWDPYDEAPEGIEEALEAARVAAVAKAKEDRAFPCELKSFAFG